MKLWMIGHLRREIFVRSYSTKNGEYPSELEYSGGIIHVGNWAKISKTISREDVRLFSELSGDKNPVHLDDEYAVSLRIHFLLYD